MVQARALTLPLHLKNTQIKALFTTAVGLQPRWHDAEVELNTGKWQMDFEVEHTSKRPTYPARGADHKLIYERVLGRWRHLDFC